MCRMVIKANAAMLLVAAGLSLVACNKKDSQVKPNGLPKAAATNAGAASSVAVVDIDTLLTKSEYCKDKQKELENKQKKYNEQLNSKEQAFQNAMVSYQKKMQSGAFTSQQQLESAQAQLQKQQQAIQDFQVKKRDEIAQAEQNIQKKLFEDLNTFLKSYNSDGRFKVIISKGGVFPKVLYSDPSVDITEDVIAGLNKSYKK